LSVKSDKIEDTSSNIPRLSSEGGIVDADTPSPWNDELDARTALTTSITFDNLIKTTPGLNDERRKGYAMFYNFDIIQF
jgi:hypothetical protein